MHWTYARVILMVFFGRSGASQDQIMCASRKHSTKNLWSRIITSHWYTIGIFILHLPLMLWNKWVSFSIMYCYFAELGVEDLFMQLWFFFFNLKKKTQGLSSMCPFFSSHTCWASAICGVLLVNGIMEPSVGVFHFLPLLCLTIPVITAFILLPMARTNYLISNKLSKFTLTGKMICITMIQMQESNKSKKKNLFISLFLFSLWSTNFVVLYEISPK